MKAVRVVCVAHFKRFETYVLERDEDLPAINTHSERCNLSGPHSYMWEDKTTPEQFEMYWQQAI